MTRVLYLHGFTSSPQSRKARYFAAKFAEHEVEFHALELDEGNFQSLSVTGQLAVIDRAVAGNPAILMGSSLGGYLAALYASRHSEVERLVLLAPAFQFARRWRERLTREELDRWKGSGALRVFHYGAGEERRLGYQFLEDAARYEEEPEFVQPALILHGTGDEVVPAEVSRTYAASHPSVTLRLFNSGHELTDVLDPMWAEIREFLPVPKVIAKESN